MWPKYWSFSISPSNEYSGLISLEEEVATHSSILAWQIQWTEEEPWWATVHGIARVEQDLATEPPPAPLKKVGNSQLLKTYYFPF